MRHRTFVEHTKRRRWEEAVYLSTWNDNKGEPRDRPAQGDIMQRADLNIPNLPLRSFPLGMAIGVLADIAIKLIISGYVLAVVVYVNATGNWDKDDDLGTLAIFAVKLYEE